MAAKKVKLQVITDAVQHGGSTYANGEQSPSAQRRRRRC
jgi:hypothetical protein